jgi:hypothetical protein
MRSSLLSRALRVADRISPVRNTQRLSADIDLYIRALAEYDGPDGWVQAQRTGTTSSSATSPIWMTKKDVHAFYAEFLDLLRKHSYSEELAPPDARPMAVRFLAIPQADPPAAAAPPS